MARTLDAASFRRMLGLGLESGRDYVVDERAGATHSSRAPDEWVRTTCGYCSVGCGMYVGVRDGKAIAVKGDPEHPVNRGRLCPKGLSEHHTLSGTGRLTTPTRWSQDDLAHLPLSWDDALGATVDGIRGVLDRHGPEAMAVISTGQLVTEEFYALGKLVRLGLGLKHYDGNTTLCMSSAVSGYKMAFGSDGPPGAYDDFEQADCILLIGANIADNHPLLAPRVLGNRDAALIVVDPRVTKTAQLADLHLAITPRSDIDLLNGLMRILRDEGLIDAGYVADHTNGWDELSRHLDDYPPDEVAARCGISEDDLRAAALAFGRAGAATAAWTMGVNHSVQGTETSALVTTLCAITGNLGKPGASPLSITGQCNAMGTRETGFTASMPGYRPWGDAAAAADLAAIWGVDVDRIGTERGRAYPDIISGVLDGTIKGLWIIGTNPVVSFPNRGELERALGRLEFLVVQDGFDSPTVDRADIVLPAAVWGEKDGTYTNSERRVSRARRCVAPPGEARSDFDIFLALADRLGVTDEIYPGWAGPESAFDEWRTVSAGRLCDYSGITWDRIDAAGGVQWPCPDGAALPVAGTARLYADGRVQTPDGRIKLTVTAAKPLTEAPNEHYPLLLNTGRTVEHWHTRTKTARVDILERLAPEAWVEVNPVDAAEAGLSNGSRCRLTSRRGAVENISVRVTSIVRPGEVFVPFHYDEWCVNRLTLDEFDPISREPNYKQCAVRLEPA